MPFELFYIYASDRSYGLDWIWVSIYVIIVDWIGLGHRVDELDCIGLDLENWTHVQLCFNWDETMQGVVLSAFPTLTLLVLTIT